MDVNKLKSILILAQIGNISKASDYQFVSQPTFSRYIQEVESEYGVVIFKRTKNGVLLTDEGKMLIPLFKEIVSRYDDFDKEVRNVQKRTHTRHLDIGYCMAHRKCLADYASKIRRSVSDIEIDYHEVAFSDMPLIVHDHQVDLCLIQGDDHPFMTEFSKKRIAENVINVIMSKNHPLARKSVVSTSDLEKEKFVALNRAKGGVVLDRRRYEINGFVPTFVRYFDTIPEMLFNVASSDNIAFFCSIYDSEEFNLVSRNIAGELEQLRQDLFFMWDSRNPKSDLINRYVSLL
ncbi:MAG: LysR family transcriptional regulator [Firmicutes bacterium]|nr:LysR family transcriptional regulator [Bacillota bacterium]